MKGEEEVNSGKSGGGEKSSGWDPGVVRSIGIQSRQQKAGLRKFSGAVTFLLFSRELFKSYVLLAVPICSVARNRGKVLRPVEGV